MIENSIEKKPKPKMSRFLDDIFKTVISQVVVIVFGMIVMKLMAVYLSKEYFGIFGIIKRWIAILAPLVLLNLNLGLARNVGSEPEKSKFYMDIAFIISGAILSILLAFITIFPQTASILIFDSPNYTEFVFLSYAFLLASVVNTLSYSYFRGIFDMKKANTVWVMFAVIPVFPALLAVLKPDNSKLLLIYFIFTSILGVFFSFYWLRGVWNPKHLFRWGGYSFKDSKALLIYSMSRIPAVFFISLTLGIPVFIATYRIGLAAAGTMTVITSIVRYLSIVATPFSMVFLPRFSYLKSREQDEDIKRSCHIVIDFIVTFLPFMAAALFGLTRFLIVSMFDKKYLAITDSMTISILFSVFYVAYVLLRGILDGLFDFPYMNFITFGGIAVNIIVSIILYKQNDLFSITLAFCMGLVTIGLSSLFLLVKKVKIPLGFQTVFASFFVSGIAFGAFYFTDRFFTGFHTGGIVKMGILVSVRTIVFLVVFLFYWRQMLWYKELEKRIRVKV